GYGSSVLNDDRLSKSSAHFVRQKPCHDVRRTARGRAYNEFDRAIGKGLRALKDQKLRNEQHQNADDFLLHIFSLKAQVLTSPGEHRRCVKAGQTAGSEPTPVTNSSRLMF